MKKYLAVLETTFVLWTKALFGEKCFQGYGNSISDTNRLQLCNFCINGEFKETIISKCPEKKFNI